MHPLTPSPLEPHPAPRRRLHRTLLSVAALLTLLPVATRAAPPPGAPEVLVSADAFAIPEELRPKPGKPIHYIFTQMQQTLGEVVAGVKTPAPEAVEQLVEAELIKQGFVPARAGGPQPSIYILASWGTANFWPNVEAEMTTFLLQVPDQMGGRTLTPQEKQDEAARIAYLNSPRFRDKVEVETIVGAKKTGAAPELRSRVLAAANDDRLYLTLVAFDAMLLKQKKEKKMLWRTSMSVDWRNDFALSLPAMLASGGPLFGTANTAPIFLDDRDRRRTEVQIGEARVVPDDAPPAPPANTKK